MADALLTEMEWYRDPQEVVIGTVNIDHTDRDWVYIVLGRDEIGQFRWIDDGASYDSPDEARNSLDAGYLPASHLISELAYAFTDPDGNFIEQFQTNGFDARMWELYLFIMLSEEGRRFNRMHNAPDFVCDHFGLEFSVEAVTMNPSQAGADPEPPRDANELHEYNENFTPIRFGRSLLAKLRNRYWNLPHVANRPLVLAIHDFHQSRSMIWSHSGLPIYLCGYRHEPRRARKVDRPTSTDRKTCVGKSFVKIGVLHRGRCREYQ